MPGQITLRKLDYPVPGGLNDDIDFICKSFGYFNPRDKQYTAGKIFRLLVKEVAEESKGLRSDEIAEKLHLTRGGVVYHLNSFISSGLVIKESNTYRLRSQSLQKCIDEIQEDMYRMLSQMREIARDVDNKLGHYYR
jgi:predicted transcriptional regulator